jgi:phosphotransferase system HPr (HPr) family protein
MQREIFHMVNQAGMHARPAALVVKTAAQFQARVTLSLGEKKADARSLLMLMGLGAKQGTDLAVEADGPDEAAALAAIRQLFAENFGE